MDLAKMEVLNHNKHDLERMLQNVNFKEEGMSMQEKALKIIKKDGEISVQK